MIFAKSQVFPLFAFLLWCFSINADRHLKDSMLAGQWNVALEQIKSGVFTPDIKIYDEQSSHYGATALTYAAQQGKYEIVAAMIEECLKRNIPLQIDASSKAGPEAGKTTLWYLSQNADKTISTMTLILDKFPRVNVNAAPKEGDSENQGILWNIVVHIKQRKRTNDELWTLVHQINAHPEADFNAGPLSGPYAGASPLYLLFEIQNLYVLNAVLSVQRPLNFNATVVFYNGTSSVFNKAIQCGFYEQALMLLNNSTYPTKHSDAFSGTRDLQSVFEAKKWALALRMADFISSDERSKFADSLLLNIFPSLAKNNQYELISRFLPDQPLYRNYLSIALEHHKISSLDKKLIILFYYYIDAALIKVPCEQNEAISQLRKLFLDAVDLSAKSASVYCTYGRCEDIAYKSVITGDPELEQLGKAFIDKIIEAFRLYKYKISLQEKAEYIHEKATNAKGISAETINIENYFHTPTPWEDAKKRIVSDIIKYLEIDDRLARLTDENINALISELSRIDQKQWCESAIARTIENVFSNTSR